MNPEPPVKRPKLDAVEDEEDREKPIIPDDVLFCIFSLLSIRDRMRLSLVSKRFRRLIHFDPKRTVWKDISSLCLALDLSNGTPEPRTTINGVEFNTQSRTNALQLLLDNCAPFKRVEVAVFRRFSAKSKNDKPWMNLFLDRLLEAQTAAGKGAPPELSFEGSLLYAPVVFEKLIDGTQTNIDITIGIQYLDSSRWPAVLSDFDKIWSNKISTCDGLTEINFSSVKYFLFSCQHASVTALADKESLQRLSFKMLNDSIQNDEEVIRDGRHGRFFHCLAAVANSCPRLVALHYEQELFDRVCVCSPLIPLLEPATRQRLREFTVSGNLSLELLRTLATQFPNLTQLNINLMNAAVFIEGFLAEHQFEDKILNVNLRYVIEDFENHTAALFEEMKLLCDCLAMAPDGRFAFVKGSALVACKFVQANWPGPDLLEGSF